MNRLTQFDIDLVKLSRNVHEFSYTLEDTFFGLFEESLVQKGKVEVKLTLTKSEALMDCVFTLHGEIELVCDRSLEAFMEPVDTTHHLIFKFGEEHAELSEEIEVIPRDLPKLNIANYLNEFIGLAVPMKKLHPKYRTEDATHDEDYLVYTTRAEDEVDDEDDFVDPRWLALNKLKDKENNN